MAINPTKEILIISVTKIFFIFFKNPNKTHMVTAVNNNLYQTIIPSFIVMSLPNIPVKPAKKTATCN